MEELNTMLARLEGEGEWSSTGVFTISLQSAADKLAAYRLADPALFVLNLIAAAVCGGASSFAVDTYADRTVFYFDSRILPLREELASLPGLFLMPEAPAFLRELALAVHGARGLPGAPALRVLVGGEVGLQAVPESDTVEVTPLASCDVPSGVVLELAYPSRRLWDLGKADKTRRADVLKHMFHFCRHAPLDLRYNGQSRGMAVNLGLPDSGLFAWRSRSGQQLLRTITPGNSRQMVRSERGDSPACFSFVLGFAPRDAARQQGLLIVSRGVAFHRSSDLLGFSLACGAVSADHLEKNVSQSDLAEGTEFEALIEVLREQVREMIVEVCRCLHRGVDRRAQAELCRAMEEFYADKSRPEETIAFVKLWGLGLGGSSVLDAIDYVEYWRGLVEAGSEHAAWVGADMAQMQWGHTVRMVSEKRWLEAELSLRLVADLGLPISQELRPVLLHLAGKGGQSRALAGEIEVDPMLAFLLGKPVELAADSRLGTFLRFEKAVSRRDLKQARPLALALEKLPGTPFLFLWLGWFRLTLKDHEGAALLWERAAASDLELYRRDLWPELAGKVSVKTGLRWGMANLKVWKAARPEKLPPLPSGLPHPLSLAREVWLARQNGQHKRARQVFLSAVLRSLLLPETLQVARLDAPGYPYSPFLEAQA